MTDLWVNDRDIADYGCVVVDVAGWWDAPTRALQSVQIPGRMGPWATNIASQVAPRSLAVRLLLTPASMAARKAALASLYSALQGVVELRLNDDPYRFTYVVLSGGSATSLAQALVESRMDVTLKFDATDPLFYDVTWNAIAIPIGSTVRRTIPIGTAPFGGVLRLTGAGTNPCTVTLRDQAGNSVQTMTLATTWTTAEYVEIDCDQWTVKKWSAGAATNILSTLGALEQPLIFSPEDQPTLTITGCGGAVLYYRKADLV
jgi:hypothetical protein